MLQLYLARSGLRKAPNKEKMTYIRLAAATATAERIFYLPKGGGQATWTLRYAPG